MLIFPDWPLGLMVTAPVPILLWVIVKHGERMNQLFLPEWKWSDMTTARLTRSQGPW